MKKLTLTLFAGLTVLFGVLLCVSVIGCGNSAGGDPEQTQDDENEIKIEPYYGEATYDKSTKTVKFPAEWKNFQLPLTEAKDKYICVEYSNLKGGITLYVHYDDGDNNYDNDGNPYTQESFVSYKDKIYLELEEFKYISSKKIRIKFLSITPAAEVTINKIYFTGEKIENKSPVIDKKSDENAVAFDNTISSINFVKDMGVGFNLGNCYEAHKSMNDPADIYLGWDGHEYWAEPDMSEKVIKALGEKFGKDDSGKSNAKTIRIPVTWYNHIIDDKYTIDPYWMENVKKAVDYALALDYYVIINSHHDTPETHEPLKYHEGYILRDTPEDIAESERFLKAIWEQICKAFNNSYDEHLIFETMNEPLNSDDQHWGVDKNCELCLKEAELNNRFNQLVLNTIRASGGNNAKRFVMIPNVGCDRDSGLDEVFKMPKDKETVTDKLILTVHWYPLDIGHLWKTESWDLQMMDDIFSDLNKNFVEKGIPVVLGEIGPQEGSFEKLVQGKSEEEKNLEALKPLSDLAKYAGKYNMSILIFHLSDLMRTINGKYLPEYLVEDWSNQNEIGNTMEIGFDDYWVQEGEVLFNKATGTVSFKKQYADFSLNPEYEAKDKYICLEYENLKGEITLFATYDEGDNNWYNEGNPYDSVTFVSSKTNVYLGLDESKMTASKKLKIKLQCRSENGEAEVKINRIYFTSGDSD